MSAKLDLKKQLEAVVGGKLAAEAIPTIDLVQSVATSTITLDGSITRISLIVVRPNECRFSRLLDVGGFATSGSDGKALFRLNPFLCPFGGIGGISTTPNPTPLPPPPPKYLQPVNVVATPLSSTPCYLTLLHSLVDNGADVEIRVSTWDATGAAAPNISFDWRCRVPLVDDGVFRQSAPCR